MEYNTLIIEVFEGIVTITINRERSLNALNRDTFTDLQTFFKKEYKKIKNLRGVIITGAGEKAFVAGADISEFSVLDAKKGAAQAKRGHDIFFLIERFHVPVIAAVQGYALGGGCELAMACHLRIAGEKARFGQPEVNLGLTPGYGGTQRLVQLIGKTKALELLLTGDMIDAAEAKQLGLVNHVVPVGQEVAKALEIVQKIATKAPLAVQKTIECVNACVEFGGKKGFKSEVVAFGLLCETEDFAEGAAAFMEKRKAIFKGK